MRIQIAIKKIGKKIIAAVPYQELDRIHPDDRFDIMNKAVGGEMGSMIANDVTECFVVKNTI